MKTFIGPSLLLPVMRIATRKKDMFKFKPFGPMHRQQVYRIRAAVHFSKRQGKTVIFHQIKMGNQLLKGQQRLPPCFFFYKVKKCGQYLKNALFFWMLHGERQQARLTENGFEQGLYRCISRYAS